MKLRSIFLIGGTLLVIAMAILGYYNHGLWWSFLLVGPLYLLGLYDAFQHKHAILRNYPILGHFRYLLEGIRPEIMQYFVETDTEGRPFNRIFRSLVYQRSKKVTDTAPFGTQMNVYRAGYEWMEHSMYAAPNPKSDALPFVRVGNKDCKQPYNMSLLNISAMSFGSLSKNAVMAMNKGAQMGNFAHNTGEGGISPYHLKYGGDLVWQIGTGYFGCRKEDGTFNPEGFQQGATKPEVKMIEIKISQGAKPGHGGILPAKKNTPEIAQIRHIAPYQDVHSPPTHSAFHDADSFMHFIKKCKDLSGGKPVGFKLCIGKKQEFIDLCKAMMQTGIYPDFISVDGGEGGTGAAPVEFSNSIGMPLRDGLVFVHDTLVGFGIKKHVKIIAAGKIVTGFHMARAIALGADACNSARAMMLSIGCIQALQCNTNTCPVGVATQDKTLMKGLVVEDKATRIKNYQEETVHSFLEMLHAAGLSHPRDITRGHINKRTGINKVTKYDVMFPEIKEGCLRKGEGIPEAFKNLDLNIKELAQNV